jgi:hypothetical protein
MSAGLLSLTILSSVVVRADESRAPASVPIPLPPASVIPDDDSKREFNLFHPTPSEKMRDFNPDRPGGTNSAFTVDAGHVQLELELFNYSELTTTSGKTSQWNYPNPSIRVGLTNSTEFGVSYIPQFRQTIVNPDGSHTSVKGAGDTNLTFKQNLLGNDSGSVAAAYMLGLKIPTDTSGTGNSSSEPSLMIPLSFAIGKWGIAIMPEVDFRRNQTGSGLHSEFNSPITLGHNIFGPIDGYSEIVTHTSNEAGDPSTIYFGAGLTWKVTKNNQLDLGCNWGINSTTPRVNPFAGWASRF